MAARRRLHRPGQRGSQPRPHRARVADGDRRRPAPGRRRLLRARRDAARRHRRPRRRPTARSSATRTLRPDCLDGRGHELHGRRCGLQPPVPRDPLGARRRRALACSDGVQTARRASAGGDGRDLVASGHRPHQDHRPRPGDLRRPLRRDLRRRLRLELRARRRRSRPSCPRAGRSTWWTSRPARSSTRRPQGVDGNGNTRWISRRCRQRRRWPTTTTTDTSTWPTSATSTAHMWRIDLTPDATLARVGELRAGPTVSCTATSPSCCSTPARPGPRRPRTQLQPAHLLRARHRVPGRRRLAARPGIAFGTGNRAEPRPTSSVARTIRPNSFFYVIDAGS